MDRMEAMSIEPSFRAVKRRKVFRLRDEEADLDDARSSTKLQLESASQQVTNLEPTEGQCAQPEDLPQQYDQSEPLVADILRRRTTARARRGGIEFTKSTRAELGNNTASWESLAVAEREPNALEIAGKRFAPQTGQVVDTHDEHMTAFVDSEIARLRAGNHSSAKDSISEPWMRPVSLSSNAPGDLQHPQRQPAGLGKLQEIDLGPDVSLRNIAMTEAATRRLQGVAPPPRHEDASKPVKLGKDGKPRRKRWRRNSDDVKRDEIVEAVMRESRLDLYDEPEEAPQPTGDQAADDRLAEEFKSEFMDALQSRNNLKKNGPSQTAGGNKGGGGKVEERPKGPKLGGSRSARAAMRAQEEAAKKR